MKIKHMFSCSIDTMVSAFLAEPACSRVLNRLPDTIFWLNGTVSMTIIDLTDDCFTASFEGNTSNVAIAKIIDYLESAVKQQGKVGDLDAV